MSTQLHAECGEFEIPRNIPTSLNGYYILTTDWNNDITNALAEGARDTLIKAGISNDKIIIERVPGAVELTYAASMILNNTNVDAIILTGCVIRGDTPHFDYVCRSITDGMTHLNIKAKAPVIFGVLTVNNREQAMERAGGILGNKGVEAAVAALKMVAFTNKTFQKQ